MLVRKRRQIQQTTARKGWAYMKKRDIRGQIYGGSAEKAQKAVDNAKLKKRCVLDELFPDGEEEKT